MYNHIFNLSYYAQTNNSAIFFSQVTLIAKLSVHCILKKYKKMNLLKIQKTKTKLCILHILT